jgi:hypothetical protein
MAEAVSSLCGMAGLLLDRGGQREREPGLQDQFWRGGYSGFRVVISFGFRIDVSFGEVGVQDFGFTCDPEPLTLNCFINRLVL